MWYQEKQMCLAFAITVQSGRDFPSWVLGPSVSHQYGDVQQDPHFSVHVSHSYQENQMVLPLPPLCSPLVFFPNCCSLGDRRPSETAGEANWASLAGRRKRWKLPHLFSFHLGPTQYISARPWPRATDLKRSFF